MDSPTLNPETDATRTRLLEAAGEVFAGAGFRGATIRDICSRASANVAAVNYHFGGKQGIYREVLRNLHLISAARFPPDAGLPASASPEKRLEAFISSYLLRVFDDHQPSWSAKLLARELMEPTGALDLLAKDVRPRADLLGSIIRALIGSRATEEEVRLSCISVVGQCLFYFHSRAMIERLYPQQKFGPAEIRRIAAHITRFSLQALKSSGPRRKKRP